MIIGQLHPTSAEAANSKQASTPHYIVKGWRGRRSREKEGYYRQQWCQQSFGCTQGCCGETLLHIMCVCVQSNVYLCRGWEAAGVEKKRISTHTLKHSLACVLNESNSTWVTLNYIDQWHLAWCNGEKGAAAASGDMTEGRVIIFY